MKYLIQCEFGPDAMPAQYIGTREELLSNIRSTWSGIPHSIEDGSMTIKVIETNPNPRGSGALLATFKLIAFDALPLPGHF